MPSGGRKTPRVILKTWHRGVLFLLAAGVAFSILAVITRRDPNINFLPRDSRAEWVVFPATPDARAHRFASLDAVFERDFVLSGPSREARLSVRGMKRIEVRINGVSVGIEATRNWKRTTDVDVASLLRTGSNRVEARVFNHNGPPALWLCLQTDESTLRSDLSWVATLAGSAPRTVALASAPKIPGPGNPIAGGENTISSLKQSWPVWIVLAAAAVAAIWWQVGMERFKPRWIQPVLLIGLALLWLLLALNNSRLLPFHAGFDSREHLNYIKYIQERRALPLPTEGWQMYQPPLYYLVSAAALSACRLSTADPMAVPVLRLLGAMMGVAQFLLVFLSLRLLIPGRAALVGLCLAAFLPMHLYLAQFVTNEILVATLITAAIYLCLRLLRSDNPRPLEYAGLGLALGAAMLTKATGILLLPIVVGVIAIRQVTARARPGIWFRNLVILLISAFAICGWHYVRIWVRFGTPLLGNWDVMSGFAWWQEPGYHTLTDYFRFGRSLTNPLFSGFAGFADGIYSTAWGDGLCGGVAGLTYAWNHQLMAAGYLWGLLPTTLILVGATAALVRLIRRPSVELTLLLGLCAVITSALIFMTMKVASYAQIKAFYGLSILIPLCYFGVLGWETATGGSRLWKTIVGTLLLVWAMNSLAAHWVVHSVPQHLYAVQALRAEEKLNEALDESAKAVQVDSSSAMARRFHALNLGDAGRDDEAMREAKRAVELAPTDPAVHLQLAASIKRTDPERAVNEALYAVQLGPESSSAYEFLMACFLEAHQTDRAIQLGRDWLTVSPFSADPHYGLSLALDEKGDLVSAARHLGYVMMIRPELADAHARLRRILLSLTKAPSGLEALQQLAAEAPDSPRLLDELAWLLATHPVSGTRDGVTAIRLAERACVLTDRRIPALLDTLAAAYAEAGKFSNAVSTAEEALTRAGAVGDEDGVTLSDKILSVVRQNQPYRDEPLEE